MANSIDFLIRLTDMLSPAMRAATNISNASTNQILAQFERIGTGGKRMNASVDELRARLQTINQVRFSTTIENQFNAATRAANRLEREIERIESRGRSGGSGIGSMLGGLLPGIGIVGGIGAAIKASANAEMSKTSFSTLLGDKNKGAAMYGNLNQFANETVFDNAGVYKNAETLLAFGVAGDKIMPTMRMLGDVSMGNQQKMESLTLAFAQVGSAGKLGGQDLLQFVNAGFNPLNEISKATGIKMGDLRKAMEKGAITSNMVTAAFQRATSKGGMFHDSLKNAADTVTGKWGIFMGSIQTKLVAFGDLLKPAVNLVLDFGSALLDNTPAMIMIASGIGLIAVATGGWSVAQGILNFVMTMNPIVKIISLILILGGVIYGLVKAYDGWGQSIAAIWEIIKAFGNLAWLPFKMFGENAWYHVQKLWYKIEDFAESIINTFKKVGNAWDLAKNGDFAGAKAALTANIETSASKQLQQLEVSHSKNQADFATQYANNLTSIGSNLSKIGLHRTIATSKGVDPTSANAGTDKDIFAGLNSKTADNSGAKGKADSINSGGQRSIVINIGKVVDKIEQHIVGGGREAADDFAAAVREALHRELLSLNGNR